MILEPFGSLLAPGLAALLAALAWTTPASAQEEAPAEEPAKEPLRVLIVDGQNNHDWKSTSPYLVAILRDAGYTVEVATAPPTAEGMDAWRPKFSAHHVVLSNYNGSPWSEATRGDLEEFVGNGGALVVVHAADNAFPEWKAWNEMIGLGGWGGRNQDSGPYLRLREGKWVPDTSEGRGGSHGRQHAFVMTNRAPAHPILRGLPERWVHAQDELYDRLRGPAKNLTVLASAMSSAETGGSGEEEPLLMALRWKKGRVFHTALGHSVHAMRCVGFQETLIRGVEWAATGDVAERPAPEDFPTEKEVSLRPDPNQKEKR